METLLFVDTKLTRHVSFSHCHRVKMLSTDAPQETLDTIPTRAKQIELVLYQQAPTFDDYIDMTTLKDRIKRLQECNEAGETGIIRKRGENRGL